MATTMKAAILHGREDIRIERVPIPEALPGELIVRVGRRAYLRDGLESLSPRLPCADDCASCVVWP
jgi:hypothetical protein